MASTPVTMRVPTGAYFNIYDATGIPAGSRLRVSNEGAAVVFLATSPTQPEVDALAYQVLPPRGHPVVNDGGDVGEWVYSPNQVGRISVRVV